MLSLINANMQIGLTLFVGTNQVHLSFTMDNLYISLYHYFIVCPIYMNLTLQSYYTIKQTLSVYFSKIKCFSNVLIF